MPGKVFLEIADIPYIKARLVEAIPSDWKWFGPGELAAPIAMIESGAAARNSGFIISRVYDDISLFGDPRPLILERKAPGLITFHDGQTDQVLKEIVAGFLRQGYSGHLSFKKACYRYCTHDNSARCDMRFGSWHGAPFLGEEAGFQPARIKLEWDERFGGSEADIAPIVAVCRTLGLREYVPAPNEPSGDLLPH